MELAIRQKAAKKAKKEAMEKSGMTKEEVKKKTKRLPQPQEQVFDDCGSDLGPIDDGSERALLAHPSSDLDDTVAFCFYDSVEMGDIEDDKWEDSLRDNFSLHYLLGSEVDEDGEEFKSKHPGATFVEFENLMTYLSGDKMAGDMDVMELFGGEAGVTRIALRRRLRTGENFDLITGADLTDKKMQQTLFDYVEHHQPLVVVMGPPCTAFASWSNCNRWKYPHAWEKSRKTE